MSFEMNGELITIKEVLEMAGVSRNTLYRDMNNGKIKGIKFGKGVRISKEDAEAYAEEKRNSKWVNLHKQDKDG